MKVQALLASLAFVLASANPVPVESEASGIAAGCNDSIGNCYTNGCEGNAVTLVCLAVRE
jgi:hypothetical protein